MDPFEALGDDEADAQQGRPLAAQSRDDPEPYSRPQGAERRALGA